MKCYIDFWGASTFDFWVQNEDGKFCNEYNPDDLMTEDEAMTISSDNIIDIPKELFDEYQEMRNRIGALHTKFYQLRDEQTRKKYGE